MAHGEKIVAACVIVAMCSLVAGCLPLPIPPRGYGDSRRNLPERTPDFIVEGRTSRADVILHLGTPDAAAHDERWIAYHSSRHLGGVMFIFATYAGAGGVSVEGYLERRLVVRFNAAGVVSQGEFEEKLCWASPCLSLAYIGETSVAEGAAPPATESILATFDNVVWTKGFAPVYAAYRGPVLVTNASLIAGGQKIGMGESANVRIALGDIADIARHTFGHHVGLVVTMKHRKSSWLAGAEYQFTAVKPGWLGMVDAERTDQMIKLVEERLQRKAHPR